MCELKKCADCQEFKTIDEFYNLKSAKDGKQYRCKKCSYIINKKIKDRKRAEMPPKPEPVLSEVLKECKACGEIKSIDLFSKDKWRKSGIREKCKSCYKNKILIPKENREVEDNKSIDYLKEREDFMSILSRVNTSFQNNEIELLEKFVNYGTNILVKTKYGIHKVKPYNLLRNTFPSIKSAINKTEYFINHLKDICDTSKLDFSLLEYIDSTSRVTVICKEHGEFKKQPTRLLLCRGCPVCSMKKVSERVSENPTGWSYTNWVRISETSRHFDSFKVYIIKCWNEDEEFYKIGRTFNKVSTRFHGFCKYYSYEIIQIFEGESREIYDLEVELKSKNKANKYIPKYKFNGMQECFNKILH